MMGGADALHEIEHGLHVAHVIGMIHGEIVQVEAGAERTALSRQHDGSALVIHAHLDEELVEFGHLRVGHGVEVAGVVERNDVDGAVFLDSDFLVAVVRELGNVVLLLIQTHDSSS